jgi:hypothetical protein
MLVPNRYLLPDNELSLSINQVRNDGTLTFDLTLKVDSNLYTEGINLIDSLILTDESDLFETINLPIHVPFLLYVP